MTTHELISPLSWSAGKMHLGSFFSTQVSMLLAWVLVLVFFGQARKRSIPTVRKWPWFFPKTLDRLSYNSNAAELAERGYRKFKNRPFRLLKLDMDLIVLPLRYGPELRSITSDKLDPLVASYDDNSGSVTSILLGSELHSEAIHRRLNPGLPKIIPVVVDELDFYFSKVFPGCDDDWATVHMYDLVLDLSARAAARVFIGYPLCRDDTLLSTVSSFSRNTFATIATVRQGLGRTATTSSDAKKELQYVQKLLGSEVERRRAHKDDETNDDFLQWCMDLAQTSEEAAPEALAHRTLGILSMAVVHTTAMATTHMIFDMISNPALLKQLRAEQRKLLPRGAKDNNQQIMLEMSLLDSLMRESQRFNPVGEFTFRRVVKKPLTLSDGFQLRPGEQIAMPARHINMDDSIIDAAKAWDPTRWSKQKSAAASFSHSSSTNMHFGLGRYACPGRFFASYMIKSICSRILLDYDFKLQSGDLNRPPNIVQGDKILPDNAVAVLFRRRK